MLGLKKIYCISEIRRNRKARKTQIELNMLITFLCYLIYTLYFL